MVLFRGYHRHVGIIADSLKAIGTTLLTKMYVRRIDDKRT